MSKYRVVVLKIVAGQLSVAQAAQEYGISRRHLQRLLARYRDGGLEAVDPRSRRPKSNPRSTPPDVVKRILQLRGELIARGLDAGPVTIGWHLNREQLMVPSNATIHRILTRAGLIAGEPRKRPRSSYLRFEAAQPNQTWQSDFTHWRLADGTDVEILNWLDDHARMLLSCTAHTPVTGDDVVTTFLNATEKYGIPASTLTDNGRVYTARHGGGRNAFEHLLPVLGVGHVSIRRAGRMHHLGIGRRHTGKRILAITDETTITVIHLDTGEILSEHTIDPTRGYWRNQLTPPGRWPQKRQMSRDI